VTFLDSAYALDSSFQNTSYNPPYILPSQYSWSFGDGGTDNSTSPTHTFVKPGIFSVTQTVSDAMGCRDSVTQPVYVVQINIKSFHDTLLCVSQPFALLNTVSSIPQAKWDYNFSWNESSPNLDHNNVQIPNLFGVGTFTDILTVTIPGIVPDGCPSLDTIVIHSVLGKKLDHLTAEATIDYGDRIQLHASNEVIYYWLPNDGTLDNNNINNPVATPKQTTTYTVFGYDINGCLDSADIVIHVDTTMFQDVPSAFTPNGDGNNDVFRPVGIKFQYMVEFRVFNRWGQEMFFTNSKEIGWDGTFHGVPQDLGVYNYLIRVAKPGQDNVIYKGNVTLIR
jgi:gliding motility-associated-like protein